MCFLLHLFYFILLQMCKCAEIKIKRNKYFLHVFCKHQYSQAKAVADNHMSLAQHVIVMSCIMRLIMACITYCIMEKYMPCPHMLHFRLADG